MAENPDKAVYDVLAADGTLSGETIRVGRPNDTPVRGIWCLATGGIANVPIQGDVDIRQPTVQIICRAKKERKDLALDLAYLVKAAINRTVPTGYTSARVLADPLPISPDENGRELVTLNVALVVID